MLAIQPRIFHKGLILLLVPLLFEIVVAASLLYLQHFYDQSVKAETLRKQIVFHINEFWFYSTEVTTSSLGTVFVKDFEPPVRSDELASKEYAQLKVLLAGDPQQLRNLENIMIAYHRCRELCRHLTPSASDTSGRIAQLLALKSNLNTCKRLLAANIAAGSLIRSFREHELQQSVSSAEQVRTVAWFIQLVLASAILGSALIAVVLFRYFMQGIHNGVQTLVGNIERFKSGEPLAPSMRGTDEIALLDARFHEMAGAVAAAQRMKQAFVSTLSCEFRAPITATRECLGKLAGGSDSALSERGKNRARDTEESLRSLIGLINDLLKLEAPGKARIEILQRNCSLAEIIQTSIDAVSALAEKNGIRLEATANHVGAYADPQRIVQVLVNLLSNAVKFSRPGSVVIVSTHAVNEQVEVRVTDEGRGVPAHLREAIFQPFRQVTSGDATEKGGTGLGLPICQEIVELHGGTIGVESEEGKGSMFWFRLPARGQIEE